MKYSVLLAALLAVSMTACSKKEETTVLPAEPAMEAPAPMEAAPVEPAPAPMEPAPMEPAPTDAAPAPAPAQ